MPGRITRTIAVRTFITLWTAVYFEAGSTKPFNSSAIFIELWLLPVQPILTKSNSRMLQVDDMEFRSAVSIKQYRLCHRSIHWASLLMTHVLKLCQCISSYKQLKSTNQNYNKTSTMCSSFRVRTQTPLTVAKIICISLHGRDCMWVFPRSSYLSKKSKIGLFALNATPDFVSTSSNLLWLSLWLDSPLIDEAERNDAALLLWILK